MFFKRKKILVTHDGTFHADDVFAAATIILFLEKRKEKWKLIRGERNFGEKSNILDDADYVFDIGLTYNSERGKFDHHQIGGAGKRENGIEYASFGLVWKEFGMDLCHNNEKVFEDIDKTFVQSIDAVDNGQDISKNLYKGVFPFGVGGIVGIFRPIDDSENDDEQFMEVLGMYIKILKRKILVTVDKIKKMDYVKKIAEENLEENIIILDKNVNRSIFREVLLDYKNFLFIIYPVKSSSDWKVETLTDEQMSFKSRKDLPEEWAGLGNEELQKVTGISDAKFCHRGRFLCVAESKEGIEKLARLGLSSSNESTTVK